MSDKKYKILDCTIEQDQYNVATQWANTFLHNPSDDVAVKMTELAMACVAMGDFKTQAYMSSSEELKAPSNQLTIADYLSHASRIIIDYRTLSKTNADELLSYFPEPDPSNTVFSRSATHNVYQTNEDIVEGKGLLIGIAGQLPSTIKTPRDFGINIAMGGAGQSNYYGKKISANGFSGHFYFHQNKADNLLMIGLEQSAPSASALDVLKGANLSAEDEQQGHDQFDQGHSLVGASDTYTAAGSLYFSNPIYQAKLILDKGVFPPEKYGAMQVVITDTNWPAIKDYLTRLRLNATNTLEDALVDQLLEKPTTAVDTEKDCLSYVALDFANYLKQIQQVIITQSELSEAEQLAYAQMQVDLLVLIKKLQIGKIECYREFEVLINKIIAMENSPEAYQQAITRIYDLFKLQLAVDPKFENTQVTPKYQFGDITRGVVRSINGYQFGDITRYALGIPRNTEESTSQSEVDEKNEKAEEVAQYQFGDVTRYMLGIPRNTEKSTSDEKKEKTEAVTPYRFGDYTRYYIWGTNANANANANNTTPVQSTISDEGLNETVTKLDHS